MAKRVGGGRYTPPPSLDLIFIPRVAGTDLSVYCSASVLGGDAWIPAGHLGLRVRASDLVGLTPAAAALRLVQAAERTLRHIVVRQSVGEAAGAPGGATGAKKPTGDTLVHVPGQMPLF